MENRNFSMPIPAPAAFVLDRLNGAGYTAYCVGGCVRDSLMGKIPADYDVTTSAKPEEMQSVFSDCRVVETGLKHGTLTVVRDGMNIEITTYRIDGAYGDCRHPEAVTFTDRLSDDLCRRDFTVNAMAYSPRDSLVDLYGGQEDLDRGIIRCVGRAEERFSEDGLRILRALRFSSVLGFTPDEECAAAVVSLTHLLGKISRERIYAEMTKLLGGKNCALILRSFPETVGFALGIPAALVTKAADAIAKDDGEPDRQMRYAIMLAPLDEKDAAAVFDSLKPSREERRAVLTYIKYLGVSAVTEYDVLSLISRTDDTFPARLARMRRLLGLSSAEEAAQTAALAETAVRENRCRSIGTLTVNGTDLGALGLRGREIGDTLAALLDSVMRGEVENERTTLLETAKKRLP